MSQVYRINEDGDKELRYGRHRLAGEYFVPPTISAGKRAQPAYISTNISGERKNVIVTYHPDPALFGFVGKKVIATGRIGMPQGQAIMLPHLLNLERIELQEDERPRKTNPTQLPTSGDNDDDSAPTAKPTQQKLASGPAPISRQSKATIPTKTKWVPKK